MNIAMSFSPARGSDSVAKTREMCLQRQDNRHFFFCLLAFISLYIPWVQSRRLAGGDVLVPREVVF